jgi:hypothetical protein
MRGCRTILLATDGNSLSGRVWIQGVAGRGGVLDFGGALPSFSCIYS